MRIIIVGTAYPYRGGLSAFNERLAYQYLKEGHEVEIYTFSLQYPNFLFPGKTQYSDEQPPKDITISRKVNSVNPFNWIKVGNEIKKKKPDILITKFWIPYMSPCLGTIERIVRKNGRTKIISILDNIIPHEKRFGDKMLVKYFVRSTDGFIAMSKSVLNDLNLFDTKRPRIFCPHPLYDSFGTLISREEALKELNLDDKYRYVLFFGIIRAYKGLDLLLEAFADERLKSMDIKLIVAGEYYEDEDKYQEMLSSLDIKDKVIMKTEFIPDSKVNLYFSACDIVAQPYKTATQSGVTQIAYHFVKSMLVTNVGGLPEIVPNGKVGYVVEKNPKKIADALIDFFSNNRMKDFEKNIVIEKEKYSWQRMTEAVEKVINYDNKK
ncbi:MAG: glycosyltransferase [Bacteroidales bacterium]|jgi:D-inositol-3-phosphate glycosyltransferase|nr:glycosyltransferase [Bacteroidales bacterium]MDD2204835.1 glycosyltransferase [Bacteroidales bacterium]MDD3914339.1 glycosyltransferase [Bacteroidales bacterium]MDD4634112.1 glycosyltransferase [Bacteroidales bacterium]